ncbi:CHAT domain-containing protein [Spirulina sp. CS-785/01]|uniref:CHAT domain-containing protein n=1 Tax=Spirulina sp. CS-785/01 TaxID=3021716 RepID=UPI00233134C3|nr:CHAT domain-containing tetratricopeptide repeat protein [Spirulina sp. CS-785/01]MDB9313358.1 CHAT domain-containing protein [Spirulina sp. CS-785/01]
MEANSIESYNELIDKLFSCADGEEAQVLQNNSHLIDDTLLELLQNIAQEYQEAEDQLSYQWIDQQIDWVIEYLDQDLNKKIDYYEFFFIALGIIEQENDYIQLVKEVLAENLDKITLEFRDFFYHYGVQAVLKEEDGKTAYQNALCISYFCWVMQLFTQGDEDINLEVALAGYKVLEHFFTYDKYPENWVELQSEKAFLYTDANFGDRLENIEKAIQLFQNALRVYTPIEFWDDWFRNQYALASRYYEKFQLNYSSEDLEAGIQCYQRALQFCDFNQLSELNQETWGEIQNDLGIAYMARLKGERFDNLENAIAAFQATLKVFTLEDYPENYSLSYNNLGWAYYNRLKGERIDNIEKAIESYNLGLQGCSENEFIGIWIKLQINLSVAYLKSYKGNIEKNRQKAINACESVLKVLQPNDDLEIFGKIKLNLAYAFQWRKRGRIEKNKQIALQHYQDILEWCTPENYPEIWALVHNNLGTLYLQSNQGTKKETIEKTIHHYQSALQTYSKQFDPLNWAMIHHNLGYAYYSRQIGQRSDNLELALQELNIALEVRQREYFPYDWADTQYQLAFVYKDRLQEDWWDNQEMAIECCQNALEVHTQEDYPAQWAKLQNLLGMIYVDRQYGDSAENQEQAIAYYQNALQIYAQLESLEDWSNVKLNLGSVYCDRLTGDEAKNLETALVYYHDALSVRTRDQYPEDWASLQNHLGKVYSSSLYEEQPEKLILAIHHYQAALEIYNPEDYPQEWAMVQNNLGNSYQSDGKIESAIAAFQAALTITQPQTHPQDCLRTARNLGEAALEAQNWSKAIQGYKLALEAADHIYSQTLTDDLRQILREQTTPLYDSLIEALIRNGQPQQAFLYSEKSRSRYLVELMASQTLSPQDNLPPHLQNTLHRFDQLQRQIDRVRLRAQNLRKKLHPHQQTPQTANRAALAAFNHSINNLEVEKQDLWQEIRHLDPVLAGQLHNHTPTLDHLQTLIDHRTTAILSFYTTLDTTYIFIVTQTQIHHYPLPDQNYQTLQTWIENQWLTPYAEACQPQAAPQTKLQWQQQIPPFLHQLAQRLQLNPLIEQYLQTIEELIIIPHLYLHQIPWAALPLRPNYHLSDKFLLRILPSCQVLDFCHQRPPLTAQNYAIIEDATEDLPCAQFEGQQVATLYNIPPTHRLTGRSQATVHNYRHLLQQQQINVLLASHHAQTRLDQPLESTLHLGDGTITLGQLMTPAWRLPHLAEVFLSCCETGLGVAEISDDLLTLSTGFLCAGARSVISSLWAVDDIATALFSIFYHRYRHQGACRPAALQHAQSTLRTLTGDTLAQEYQPTLEAFLEQRFRQAEETRKRSVSLSNRQVRKSLRRLVQEEFPFAHPYYWAGFTCAGLR